MIAAIVLFELCLIVASAPNSALGEELVRSSSDVVPVNPSQEVPVLDAKSADDVVVVSVAEKRSNEKGGKKALPEDEAKVAKVVEDETKEAKDEAKSGKDEAREANEARKAKLVKDEAKAARKPKWARVIKARAQQVDRQLIESLGLNDFLDGTSELLTDLVQELGGLVSGLTGGGSSRSGSPSLEDRVLTKLSARSRKIGNKTKFVGRDLDEKKKRPNAKKQANVEQEIHEARRQLMRMLQQARVSSQVKSSDDNGDNQPADDDKSSGDFDENELD